MYFNEIRQFLGVCVVGESKLRLRFVVFRSLVSKFSLCCVLHPLMSLK